MNEPKTGELWFFGVDNIITGRIVITKDAVNGFVEGYEFGFGKILTFYIDKWNEHTRIFWKRID